MCTVTVNYTIMKKVRHLLMSNKSQLLRHEINKLAGKATTGTGQVAKACPREIWPLLAQHGPSPFPRCRNVT